MSNNYVYVRAPPPLIWVPAIVIRRDVSNDSINDSNNVKTVVEFQSNSANEDSPYYEGKQVRVVYARIIRRLEYIVAHHKLFQVLNIDNALLADADA